ncbi:MAG: 4Fe-4S binding protein [Deltaproteobacteria bacterium]|nr:4Fe-4S binding protein [Deltaproteobacteria bacterium]
MNFLKRRIVQGIGTFGSNGYFKGFVTASLYQGPLKGFCVPALNCYACPGALFSCPIGTMQHFMVTRNVPFYSMGILGVVGSSIGRMACGTLCPFGFLQDILYKIRTWKFPIPKILRYGKYLSLAGLVFVIPYLTRENWFSKLCPMGTLTAGIPWVTLDPNIRAMIQWLFWVKISILLFFVSTSVLTKRPFCRVVCPLGAIFSVFNKASFFKLEWNPETCTKCGKCQDICPVDIRVDEEPNSVDCVRCLDCTRCPSVKSTTIFAADPFSKGKLKGAGEADATGGVGVSAR